MNEESPSKEELKFTLDDLNKNYLALTNPLKDVTCDHISSEFKSSPGEAR